MLCHDFGCGSAILMKHHHGANTLIIEADYLLKWRFIHSLWNRLLLRQFGVVLLLDETWLLTSWAWVYCDDWSEVCRRWFIDVVNAEGWSRPLQMLRQCILSSQLANRSHNFMANEWMARIKVVDMNQDLVAQLLSELNLKFRERNFCAVIISSMALWPCRANGLKQVSREWAFFCKMEQSDLWGFAVMEEALIFSSRCKGANFAYGEAETCPFFYFLSSLTSPSVRQLHLSYWWSRLQERSRRHSYLWNPCNGWMKLWKGMYRGSFIVQGMADILHWQFREHHFVTLHRVCLANFFSANETILAKLCLLQCSGYVLGEMQPTNTKWNWLCIWFARCHARLGSFNWAGMQSSKGDWMTPAFALQLSKLDSMQSIVDVARIHRPPL